MKQYKLLNNVIGWLVFGIATFVYLITCEPTASFWDCGEYISTAYKLQVGHPPGAPLFQMIGRIFTLFAFGDTSKVAYMVNSMSAIASAFTILFLFWSLTMLAKKIAIKAGEAITTEKMLVIFGSGIVGALAYTFSDSFWFSAVEGEVYATSAFFTAIVFWAMLKWEEVADSRYAFKWIVLIAFLMGLSIGVHLLNLLTIPAMTFIYYFKKYQTTRKGLIYTGIISVLLLGIVQAGIIPNVVSLAGRFELFFINTLGMPFNTGILIYFLVLVGGVSYGLHYTYKNNKVVFNTIILSFAFIIIGYSSFLMLVIRSNAATPINENKPVDAIGLLAYLNREQYGDWPILYGPYYNAPLDAEKPYKDGNPSYRKNKETGKYEVIDERKQSLPNYDSRFCTIFPRMWSPQHVNGYLSWGKVKGEMVMGLDGQPVADGQGKPIMKPTFKENLLFFFNYQLGHMYMRYFMWNFAGRQNDLQGMGSPLEGNWISGIKALDEARLGPQDNLPDQFAVNKGRNAFYFLPLILGLIGLFYHLKVNYKDMLIVAFLFILTGLAINIYLNPVAPQPRERDYAYAGSFYPFCIWIGLSVMAIWDTLRKYAPSILSGALATSVCLVAAPGLMAKEGWDDHDRSDRYAARDFALNYLNSCEKNAVIFTNGDNDTFPLWYAQEVENERTDVRVCNLSLLNTDWYIDQMKRKAYESDALPFSLTEKQYQEGTRDYVYIYENKFLVDITKPYPLDELIKFVASDDPQTKLPSQQSTRALEYFPTKKFMVPVDKALVRANGTVPAHIKDEQILPALAWELNKYGVYKSQLMILDLIAHNDWKRPVYFANTTGADTYLGLDKFFSQEGLAFRLVPYVSPSPDGQPGGINTTKMYDNVMHKFKWGNIQAPDVYINEDILRMTWNFKMLFSRLANALAAEGKKDSAIKVCDKCMEVFPEKKIPINYFNLGIAEAYYRAGAKDKANVLMGKIINVYEKELAYYFRFTGSLAASISDEREQGMAVIQRCAQFSQMMGNKELADKANAIFNKYIGVFSATRRQEVPQEQTLME